MSQATPNLVFSRFNWTAEHFRLVYFSLIDLASRLSVSKHTFGLLRGITIVDNVANCHYYKKARSTCYGHWTSCIHNDLKEAKI